MTPRVESLFHTVADLAEERRPEYFAAHAIGATTLRQVQALLEFDSPDSLCLEQDIGQAADRALAQFEPRQMLCGPYRLGQLLGRGGMGTVHIAERVDGEVAQRVAVKLLRPGVDDPILRRRFLTERQIMAALSHPNIGRLLDAGHSEDGQPYLVMEYVEGRPIDVYAAEIGIRQTIALFLKVCDAVGYLHRNLVVHRDLKPANILVTAGGEPKLLDFGIARMLDVATESTMTSMRLLTPDYASPEQVAGGAVTTATDIYSLGAVLFKLLTGSSPHRFAGDSMEAIASGICAGRITPPSRLSAAVKGDLEMILMKALRKEPQERYATIEQFCEDLRNYVDSGPIRARKGDAWYRARKLLRRHWMPALATGLVIASLSAGLYVANRQRALAERRFGQLRHLSTGVIDLDGAIRTLPGSLEARRRLVAVSLEYLEGLSHEASENPELAEEIADGYWRMARIQGVNTEFNLGDHAKAEDSLKKAAALIETVLAQRPGDRNALFRSAVIAHDRTNLADVEQRPEDVVVHAGRAVERLESFMNHDDHESAVHLEGFLQPGDGRQAEGVRVALMYSNIALAYVNIGRYAEGARYARRAVEIAQSVTSAKSLQPQVQGLSVWANALRYQGDLDSALALISRARRLAESSAWPTEAARFFALYGVLLREGRILGEANAVNLGRTGEAVDVLGKALALTEEAARKDAHDSASRGRVGTSARELGAILRNQDPERALSVFNLGLRRLEEAGNSLSARREQATLLAMSSYPLRRLGRFQEAKEQIDAALAILKDTNDYPARQVEAGSQVWVAVCALADYEAETGDPHHAAEEYEQLLDEVTAANARPLDDLRAAPQLSSMYEALTDLYNRTGDTAKSVAMKSRRAELWRHWQIKLPNNPFVRRQLSGLNLPPSKSLISMRGN
jgi:tetratricopeptide (TPR) repeat protein/tRNA A-37 threonylcarbamoyl transferase component Bud32